MLRHYAALTAMVSLKITLMPAQSATTAQNEFVNSYFQLLFNDRPNIIVTSGKL